MTSDTMANNEKSMPSQADKEHIEVSPTSLKGLNDEVAGEPVQQGDYSGAAEKTDPLEIKLVRKLDYRIMVCHRQSCNSPGTTLLTYCQPILWAMYFLNYLDRNALPQARLNTLEEDLNLEGVQYNTAISVLFVGYLLMQGQSQLITRIPYPS